MIDNNIYYGEVIAQINPAKKNTDQYLLFEAPEPEVKKEFKEIMVYSNNEQYIKERIGLKRKIDPSKLELKINTSNRIVAGVVNPPFSGPFEEIKLTDNKADIINKVLTWYDNL